MQATEGSSNLQLELLFNISNNQLLEIKQLLANYFANKISNDIDELFTKKNRSENKIEEWSNEHVRTSHQ